MNLLLSRKTSKIDVRTLIGLALLMLITSCAPPPPTASIVIPVKNPVDSVTIQPFSAVSRLGKQYAPYLTNLIETGIANEGFTLVTRDSNIVLSGHLNFGEVQTETFTKTSELGTKKKTIYHCVKKLTVTGNYSLSDKTAVEQTIAGKPFNVTRAKEGLSHQSMTEAKVRTVTDEQLIHFVLEEIAKDIVSTISYHKAPVELKTGSDPGIEQGITYLTHGRVLQAIGLWEQVVNDLSVSDPDKAAAYYNIGTAKESQGGLEEAYEFYHKANTLDSDEELYMQALTRVKRKFMEMGK